MPVINIRIDTPSTPRYGRSEKTNSGKRAVAGTDATISTIGSPTRYNLGRRTRKMPRGSVIERHRPYAISNRPNDVPRAIGRVPIWSRTLPGIGPVNTLRTPTPRVMSINQIRTRAIPKTTHRTARRDDSAGARTRAGTA